MDAAGLELATRGLRPGGGRRERQALRWGTPLRQKRPGHHWAGGHRRQVVRGWATQRPWKLGDRVPISWQLKSLLPRRAEE